MKVREELVRAGVYADLPAATIVWLHRIAPLIELAREIETAEEIERAAELLIEARVIELCDALIDARRDATLAWARVAALEVAA